MGTTSSAPGKGDGTKVLPTWCLYRPRLFAVIEGAEGPEEVTEFLMTVELHYHYEENVFPFLGVHMVIPKGLYLRMFKSRETLLFTFSVERYDAQGETPEAFHVSLYEDVVLKPTGFPALPVESARTTDTDSGGDSVADNAPQVPVTLFLFAKDHLLLNKKTCPLVLSDSTVSDAVLHLASKNFGGTPIRAMIGPMDNPKKYGQVIVPPSGFANSVRHLQKAYGAYKGGVHVFVDFKRAYVMDVNKTVKDEKDPKSTADVLLELYGKGDGETSGGGSDVDGFFYDEENGYYVVRTSFPAVIAEPKGAIKELVGEAVQILSSSQDEHGCVNCVDFTFGGAPNDPKRPKERTYWGKYSNPLAESEFKTSVARELQVVTLVLRDADLEVLCNNRIFNLVSRTEGLAQGIDGSYKVSDLKFKIDPQGGAGKSKATAVATFKRVVDVA